MVGAFVNLGLFAKATRAISTSSLPRQQVLKATRIGPGAFVSNVKLFNRASSFPSGTREQHHAATTFSSPLVTVGEINEALSTSPGTIRCVDASWHLGSGRDAKQEFMEGHLPGAVFFDIDDVADKAQPLPHMIPSQDVLSARVSELGISNSHTIVVYAKQGSFSAPRCWWTFRTFGHEAVHVLDGGFPAWEASGGSDLSDEISSATDGRGYFPRVARVEKGEVKPASTRPSPGLVQSSGNMWKLKEKGFQARLNAPMLRTWRQVLSQSEQGKEAAGQIVDARSLARFRAEAPEPRAGVAGGHIPGSASLPFNKVLEEENVAKFLPPDEIKKAFEDAGVDVESPLPITTTCGSGVTAAVLAFALELVGRNAERSPVYDGSWSEWGSRDDLPRATGEDL